MRAIVAGLIMCCASPAAAQELTHAQYALQCATEIASVPSFSCGDGVLVPVTKDNGTPVTFDTFEAGQKCDRPALLFNGKGSDGQCVPGSRILNLSTDKAQVSVMCRAKFNRPEDDLMYDEIDVILHNPASGATCWFQASGSGKDAPVDGRKVISPTIPVQPPLWNSPQEVAKDGCGTCHDNDPFMYSPFMGQVWAHVPSNPLGPYYHVQGGEGPFGKWPLEVFELRDNTCLGCHRIGREATSNDLTKWMTGRKTPLDADKEATEFPLSHGMPPAHNMTKRSWDVFYEDSVAEILTCHLDKHAPECNLTPILGSKK